MTFFSVLICFLIGAVIAGFIVSVAQALIEAGLPLPLCMIILWTLIGLIVATIAFVGESYEEASKVEIVEVHNG